MTQNYAKLSFMNSDHKEVTCVCDTVHHVRLATGWTVRGSNPNGGEIFHTCPDRTWGPTQPPAQ